MMVVQRWVHQSSDESENAIYQTTMASLDRHLAYLDFRFACASRDGVSALDDEVEGFMMLLLFAF